MSEEKLIEIIKRELEDQGFTVTDHNVEHVLYELYDDKGEYAEFDPNAEKLDEDMISYAVHSEGDIGYLELNEDEE